MPSELTKLDACPEYQGRLGEGPLPKWSGAKPPPAIGDQITIAINSIGPAIVTSYATYEGWLGVMAYPLNPPEWWVKQNGTPSPDNASLVFGVEIHNSGVA